MTDVVSEIGSGDFSWLGIAEQSCFLLNLIKSYKKKQLQRL